MRNVQGFLFPKKDARFSKLKNIPDQLGDHMEGELKRMSASNARAIGRLL